MPRFDPPHWSPDQFDVDRTKSLGAFVASWGAEGTNRYQGIVAEHAVHLDRLFTASRDLAELSGATFTGDGSLVQPARFLTAPPVSADDLTTLIGGKIGAKKPSEDRAAQAAKIIRSAWDPLRFPWIEAKRSPTEGERRTAILWTASIWAIEAMRTLKRNESSQQQEDLVSRTLEGAGYTRVPRRRIQHLDDLERGSFTRESLLGSQKSDLPVRLHDGRLLAIECKVSNSAINSRKRLNKEVGANAAHWRENFGAQVVTAAVLTGVYSLSNLILAQDHQGITIFWAHDLSPLSAFVQAGGPNPT